MARDARRITLVNRSKSAPARQWIPRRSVVFVESFGAIPFALHADQPENDVECVVIDGAATAAEYLHLLSQLPAAYAGDVVLIDDDSAFVSATGRGGDRLLLAMKTEDAIAYLETEMLTEPAQAAAA